MGADQDIESVAGVLIVDALSDDLAITWASPGFELLTGYGAIEVLGRNARLLQGPDTDPRAISTIRQALADGTDCYLTVLNYRADGSPFWNELSISPQRDKHGTVVRWIAAMRDVSDRMRLQQQPQDTPDFDQLTGLPGHSALYDEMRAALHRARVHDREAALLLIDIEDFAQVNDAHGRDVGDALLRAAADRLRGLVRPGDTLARTNSDEFALLLADVPSRASEVAAELALRLDAALREPFGSDSLKIELRANTGIAVFPGALTAPELLTQAMMAADLALSQGRPYVIFQAKPARMLVNDRSSPRDRSPVCCSRSWTSPARPQRLLATRPSRAAQRARPCTSLSGSSRPLRPRACSRSSIGRAAPLPFMRPQTKAYPRARRCSSTPPLRRSATRHRPITAAAQSSLAATTSCSTCRLQSSSAMRSQRCAPPRAGRPSAAVWRSMTSVRARAGLGCCRCSIPTWSSSTSAASAATRLASRRGW
ncbi:MAG TPA: diguanylate cyclase, partial [Baekduia sp.]|nr:diguanylate cyclase [Baekduia sp.]